MCVKAFYKLKCLVRFEAITSFPLLPTYLLWSLKYNATSQYMSQNYLGSRLERACQPYSLLNAIPQWTAYNSWRICREFLLGNLGSPVRSFLENRADVQIVDREDGFMPLITCDSVHSEDWLFWERPEVSGRALMYCSNVQCFNSFAKWLVCLWS